MIPLMSDTPSILLSFPPPLPPSLPPDSLSRTCTMYVQRILPARPAPVFDRPPPCERPIPHPASVPPRVQLSPDAPLPLLKGNGLPAFDEQHGGGPSFGEGILDLCAIDDGGTGAVYVL